MVRLAMLLMGADSIRQRWWLLCLYGLLGIALAVWLVLDASDGVLFYAVSALGLFLVLQGLAALLRATGKPPRVRQLLYLRGLVLLLLGVMIALPLKLDNGLPDRVLFATAFLADGALRVASAWVVRFHYWHIAVAAGLAELLAAVAVGSNWPLHHHYTVPMVLGVILVASGWSAILLALQIRKLPPGRSITSLPIFSARSWYNATAAEVVIDSRPAVHDAPMTLYVWTPVGSAENPQRRLLVDRYIAAVDAKGVISTGHSALERLPGLYISHYPAVEIEHAPDDFAALLRAGPENDIAGRWQPDHAFEVDQWCEADKQVHFKYYNAGALEQFWANYRVDATYNLTSRSCSSVAALAIESALEGTVASSRPMLTFLSLLCDANVWTAAMLRRRGATMAWTPGLVLDYARLLRVIIHHRNRHSSQRASYGIAAAGREAA